MMIKNRHLKSLTDVKVSIALVLLFIIKIIGGNTAPLNSFPIHRRFTLTL